MRPSDPLHLVCPACGRTPVKGLVPSDRGAYCVCDFCGHKWQQEGLYISWRGAPAEHPARRKSDSHGAAAPADPTPCSHCGSIDEAHERRIRELTDRMIELEAENAILRHSARSFGDLADRLNQQLRELPRRPKTRPRRGPSRNH